MRIRKSAEDRKSEILQATLALAFEVGPDQVTTGMIAARVGLTQPAIYKHFPGKEDLWRSVTENLAAQIAENIATAMAQTEPMERLKSLILGHLQLVQNTPALPEIMVSRDRKGTQNVMRQGIKSSMAQFSDLVLATIRKAQGEGYFRSDFEAQDIATLVLGVIQSMVLQMLVSRDPSILLKDAERLLDQQLSSLARHGDNA